MARAQHALKVTRPTRFIIIGLTASSAHKLMSHAKAKSLLWQSELQAH
jgi:hypothetical protein